MRELSRDECLAHLRERYVGRVGYVDGDRPVVVTTNYRVTDAGEVAVSSRSGTKLERARAGATMCLQIDWVGDLHHNGGSVLVTGPTEVLDVAAGEELMTTLRLRPWVGADDVCRVILIRPSMIEGRRLR